MITLRGRINKEGQIELLDPLPENVNVPQEVAIVIRETSPAYETLNDFGDRVMVDDEIGLISPIEPLTWQELKDSGFVGLWTDRYEEIGEDTVAWLKEQRRQEDERDDPWRGRTLS
jgi:hypothetical protein